MSSTKIYMFKMSEDFEVWK